MTGGSGLLGVEGVQVQQVHEVGQTTKAVLGTQARAEEENGLMHVLLFCINKIFTIFTCSPVRRSTLCPGDQGAEDGLVTEAAPEEGGQAGHRGLVLRHGGLHLVSNIRNGHWPSNSKCDMQSTDRTQHQRGCRTKT